MNNPLSRGLKLLRIGWNLKKLGQTHSEAERLLAQRALSALFAEARGVTMKVGQLFADENETTPFRELLDNIEPLPLAVVKPLIESQLGQPITQVFQQLDEAQAAASLGQVHHALLHSGEEVAIKVRYPDIKEAVEAEMRLAGMMPGMGPVKKWGFDIHDYQLMLKQNMDRELNYLDEAARQEAFRQQVQVKGLYIPAVYHQLSKPGLLVQEWASGVNLDAVAEWPFEQRQEIAAILISTLFSSLFTAGMVHGDPHMGNYFFSRTRNQPGVTLLDFGCTIEVEETARMALLKLIIALREQTPLSPLQCFVAMGFDGKKLSHIAQQLPFLCRLLFQPFLANKAMRIDDWQLKAPLEKLLGEQRWWFRSAGPANLLLLLRAFQGLARQLQRLGAYHAWWPLLRESVGDEMIEAARRFSLPPLPAELEAGPVIEAQAQRLQVEVLEGGRVSVRVTLPAEAAIDLLDLIPEESLEEIRHSGSIDLDAIQQRILETNLAPQEVFSYERRGKRYHIWLE